VHELPTLLRYLLAARGALIISACGLFDGLDSFTELEVRIAALPTHQDRGDAFEVFAEAYLANPEARGGGRRFGHADDQVSPTMSAMGH
jgi:hypothetical protein